MTLIECFTNAHIDNIAACLRLHPEKMIMVGNADEMHIPLNRYQKILKQRGLRTEIEQCDVRGKDCLDICTALKKIVQEESECIIDLTGGSEMVILAVGAMLPLLTPATRQRIRIEKYDHDADVVRDCINDNCKIPGKHVDLTVEELITLHGGSLYPKENSPLKGYASQSIDGLWKIVSETPRDWNRAITYLNEFESRSDSKTQVFLLLNYLSGSIPHYEQKVPVVQALLDKFQCYGVIDDFSSRDKLEYTYSTALMRYCTQKAGNVLEVKTLLEGQAVLENGAPYFHDCQMSVSIDWDGMVHDLTERVPDTRNEIDVVLMHGTTPLFISCKNGNIGEEELYKLHTVAERFGGPYAKKMLIATNLDRKSPAANRAFIQRAWDMDIFLVTDAAELSRKEWRQIFLKAIQ